MVKAIFACAALFLAAAPSPTFAAPPSAGTQSPQLSYVRSARGYSLVIANDDGSGARTIYSSSRMINGDFGPDGMIYFWDGGRFNRMPAIGGSVEVLFDTNGQIPNHSDVSPNGASVAWFSVAGSTLYRYDLATRTQTPLAQVPYIISLTFDHTGNSIIYAEEVGTVDYELKVISAGGGTPSSLGLVGRISHIDSARGDATLALTFNPAGAGAYISLWKPGMMTPVRITDGYNPTYRCDDSAILFNRMTNSGPALYKRLSNGATTLMAKPSSIFSSYKPVC